MDYGYFTLAERDRGCLTYSVGWVVEGILSDDRKLVCFGCLDLLYSIVCKEKGLLPIDAYYSVIYGVLQLCNRRHG